MPNQMEGSPQDNDDDDDDDERQRDKQTDKLTNSERQAMTRERKTCDVDIN